MKIYNIYLRILMILQENENLFSFTVKDGVAFVTVLGRTKMVQFSSAFVTGLPNIRVGEMAQFLNKSKNIFILLIFILVLTNFDISLANNDCDLYYASLLFGSYLVDKRITVNVKKTVYNNLIKRHMRKAAQNTVLTVAQKQGISSYLYEFIKDVVDKSNKKQELLPNVVEYFKDNSMGEFVLKQTIVKGFFPKFTFFKKEVLNISKASSKLSLENQSEKSDVRFIPEMLIADNFANSQENIQKIIMNNENPKFFSAIVAKTSYSSGNYVKDITVNINTSSNISAILLDVKTGNNAYDLNGVLGPLPLLPDDSTYSVLCKDIPNLDVVQTKRNLKLIYMHSQGLISQQNLDKISQIEKMPLEKLKKNIMIQDELLKMISSSILKNNQSFFVGYKVNRKEVELSFFNKMEPYINANNFDSKKDFSIFARFALKSYYESVNQANRNKIFDIGLFKETGFDQIDIENLFSS